MNGVVKVMSAASWHTYQVLTKRASRLRQLLSSELAWAAKQDHIWWGVSVENRKYGLPRIEELRNTPVAVRFLSVEPLLEDLGEIDLRGIHWVIVGGESGFGARPMKRDWVISILEQCRGKRIPFFFKQWGGAQTKRAGRLLDEMTYDELPTIDRSPFPCRVRREALLLELQSRFVQTGILPAMY